MSSLNSDSKMYKLGLDMGSTSLGWALFEIDKEYKVQKFIDMGVRIFPDGRNTKDHKPLTVKRRESRGTRRNRDRYLARRKQLFNLLVNSGLMPKKTESQKKLEISDPYEIRARAVNEKVSLHELGRAIFHINQRRGFLSNRKSDGDQGGKLKKANDDLIKAIKDGNFKTLGEYLFSKSRMNEQTRFKSIIDKNKLKEGSLFPTRQMYRDEFDLLWETQSKFYKDTLTDTLKEKIAEKTIFYQRPLKAQEKGKCQFEDGEDRIYKAHPLFQEFRLRQTINQLQFKDKPTDHYKPITAENGNKLYDYISNDPKSCTKKGEVVFSKIKKCLGLEKSSFCNLEFDGRKSIQGNTTKVILSSEDYYGSKWADLDDEKQVEIVELILSDKSDKDIVSTLIDSYGIDEDIAKKLIIAPLESGTGSLSIKAIEKLIPHLGKGKLYNEACIEVYGKHTHHLSEKVLEKLPYYGEILTKSCMSVSGNSRTTEDEKNYGRISNISVHIALNQLREVVNAIITKYGPLAEIMVEVGRDLKAGTKERSDTKNRNTKNKTRNDAIREILKNEAGITTVSGNDINKYKIWENMHEDITQRKCIYSGTPITSVADLFSGKFEIEHILPWSKTLDDKLSNKIIASKEANQKKGGKSPYEAFGKSDAWEEIYDRASTLNIHTASRFKKDAMVRYEGDNNPIARLLNDTRYMSKLAKEYLASILENKNKVFGVSGQLTALFRHSWGLDLYKNKDLPDLYRSSHAHHAIDAFVVGCLNRGVLKFASDIADKAEQIGSNAYLGRQKILKGTNFNPYDSWDGDERLKVIKKTVDMYISYKPSLKDANKAKKDCTTIGQLHEDSAWGYIKRDGNELNALFKHTKDGNTETNSKDISTLIPIFRNKEDRSNYENALRQYLIKKGISIGIKSKEDKKTQKAKEVKLCDTVHKLAQKAYKWYISGNVYSCDIYQLHPKDTRYPKQAGEWKLEVITNYDAMNPNFKKIWQEKHPSARKVMTLKGRDLVALEIDEKTEIFLMKSVGQIGQFSFINHKDSKDSTDKKRTFTPYLNELKNKKIRKVRVSALGEMHDPGFDKKWGKDDL